MRRLILLCSHSSSLTNARITISCLRISRLLMFVFLYLGASEIPTFLRHFMVQIGERLQ